MTDQERLARDAGELQLERPRLRRSSGVLASVTLGSLLLVFLGPASVRTTARALFAPWRAVETRAPFSLTVLPGDAAVPKGGAQEIHATPNGFTTDAAELVFRA